MAHRNGKVTELKASTHMVLAGEHKDTMKSKERRKKKRLSFSKRALLFSLVYFSIAGLSYCRALEKVF